MSVVVSACLLGRACRYDGRHSRNDQLKNDLVGESVVPVCPEELGGLGTPRPAAELTGGDGSGVWDGTARVVLVESGLDVTREFCDGAQATLHAARQTGAHRAILKEGSPSCGTGRIQLDGNKVVGQGVSAALLARHGISVEARS